MWHVSISFTKWSMPERYRRAARAVLDGVGLAAPETEWWERGQSGVMHLRRRMTDDEQALAGHPVDVRGTDEEICRAAAIAPYLGLTPAQALELG